MAKKGVHALQAPLEQKQASASCCAPIKGIVRYPAGKVTQKRPAETGGFGAKPQRGLVRRFFLTEGGMLMPILHCSLVRVAIRSYRKCARKSCPFVNAPQKRHEGQPIRPGSCKWRRPNRGGRRQPRLFLRGMLEKKPWRPPAPKESTRFIRSKISFENFCDDDPKAQGKKQR